MRVKLGNRIRSHLKPVMMVFLAFFTMVLVSSIYTGGIVRDQMQMIGEKMTEIAVTKVTSNLEGTRNTFANMTCTVESMLRAGKPSREIERFLERMCDYMGSNEGNVSDFETLYAYVNGEYLDGRGWSPADAPIFQRPWYSSETQSWGGVLLSEPYLNTETGEFVLTFTSLLTKEDGSPCGFLAMDINLNRITAYVRDRKLTTQGYGILLSNTGHIAAHRNEELVGKPISEAGSGYWKLAWELDNSPTIAALRFRDVDGVDSVAFFRPLLGGWRIGIVTPISSYYDQANELVAALCILGFLLMLLLSYTLVKLQAEKTRLGEESRGKSVFLSRMSHEMRTPMNAIIGMARVARNTKEPEAIEECLDKISEASAHLLSVINDVLFMSRSAAGKIILAPEDFYLDAMLEQVQDVFALQLREKGQSYRADVGRGVPARMETDRQRLIQVLINLIGNAVKFTGDGGKIRLTVDADSQAGDTVFLRFAVTDNGIGISPEQEDILFLPFEQADGGMSRKYEGSGLGLAISKSIVEAMGGSIRVQSSLGEGSTFSFRVPVKRLPEKRSPDDSGCALGRTEELREIGRYPDKRLLVAEDVEINREVLAALMEDSGIQIDWAEDGQRACDLFLKAGGGYDLVFMDIHMPGVDGYEAVRRIRSMNLAGAKSVPIIAMTANVFREDVQNCMDAGMNGHLGKPLDPEELAMTLREFLG